MPGAPDCFPSSHDALPAGSTPCGWVARPPTHPPSPYPLHVSPGPRSAVVTYADDRALREAFYRAFNGRAGAGATDNTPVIDRMLALRRESAQLLGFQHFADYSMATKASGGVGVVASWWAAEWERHRGRALVSSLLMLATVRVAHVAVATKEQRALSTRIPPLTPPERTSVTIPLPPLCIPADGDGRDRAAAAGGDARGGAPRRTARDGRAARVCSQPGGGRRAAVVRPPGR